MIDIAACFGDNLARQRKQADLSQEEAADTKRRCSWSACGAWPASSSSGVSTVRRASSTFSRASSRVRPWLIAPGTSRMRATIQPASSGPSKEIVKSTDAAMLKP